MLRINKHASHKDHFFILNRLSLTFSSEAFCKPKGASNSAIRLALLSI